MEQRHRDGDSGHDDADPARKPVGGAFFLLNVFFGLAQLFFGNNLRARARPRVFRHRPLAWQRCHPAFGRHASTG